MRCCGQGGVAEMLMAGVAYLGCCWPGRCFGDAYGRGDVLRCCGQGAVAKMLAEPMRIGRGGVAEMPMAAAPWRKYCWQRRRCKLAGGTATNHNAFSAQV